MDYVKELIATDRAFCRLSKEKGMHYAFLFYAADEVIKLNNNQFPIIGKKALKEFFEKANDSNFVLQWNPLKAECSPDGELGYTFGTWTFTQKDHTESQNGVYFSIWKRQKDGSWKFVMDGGNPTPSLFETK